MAYVIDSDVVFDGKLGHNTYHTNISDMESLITQAVAQMAGTFSANNATNIAALQAFVAGGGVGPVTLGPSGDATGATDTANVQGTLNLSASGTPVAMTPGQWYWDATVTVPQGVWLIMPLAYRAVGTSKISLTAGFSGTSAIAFAPGTPCGAVAGLVLDGTSLPAGTVDGILCTGSAKQGSIIGVNVGHMTGNGINLTAGGGNPDGWLMREISCHDNGGDGIHWDYSVDGQLDIFHLDHNAGSGLSLGTMNNCTIGHGKCQQNTLYGYTTTGGFVKSNTTFAHCFSENNGLDGWHLNATTGGGQGSIQLMGCSTRDDGVSGSSGSGYSGFWINSKNCDVTLAGCSNYVTSSAAGPDYGLTLTGCLGNVAIMGGSYGGSVAAYHNAGGNTGTIQFDRVTTWTGQDGSRSNVAMVTTPAGATPAQFQPGNPGSTTSATPVMMGLGSTCTFTPASSGNLLVTVAGTQGTSAGSPIPISIGGRYGTGGAPVNGAASSGTAFGWSADVAYGNNSGTGRYEGFSIPAAITGLTAGTAYWFDLAVTADGTNTAQLRGVTMTIIEM